MVAGQLCNPKLKDAQQTMLGASSAVQAYVASILQQADITLTEMPDLPKHQEVARQHALKWNLTVLPGMANTTANIIDYANRFNAYFVELVKLANKVAGDSNARAKFVEALTFLRNDISKKMDDAMAVKTNLKTFMDGLEADYSTFKADAAKATRLYTGESGEITRVSSAIDQVQKTLDGDIGAMAGGAVGIVAGIVVILVGACAEITTQGLSTGLIVAGVGMLVTGITSEIAGGVAYGITVKKLVALKEELAEDKQGLMGVKIVQGQLDGLVNQLTNATAAVEALVQQWSTLNDSLEVVINDVDKDQGTYGPQLKAMLDKASEDWNETLTHAVRLQPSGQLHVKKVAKIQDIIHTGS